MRNGSVAAADNKSYDDTFYRALEREQELHRRPFLCAEIGKSEGEERFQNRESARKAVLLSLSWAFSPQRGKTSYIACWKAIYHWIYALLAFFLSFFHLAS